MSEANRKASENSGLKLDILPSVCRSQQTCYFQRQIAEQMRFNDASILKADERLNLGNKITMATDGTKVVISNTLITFQRGLT